MDGSPLSGIGVGSGMGTYTKSLIEALSRRADVAITVLTESPRELPPDVRVARVHRPMSRIVDRPRVGLIEHALRLPIELRTKRSAGDVFHNPVFHAPAGVASPWVQTLHDVIPLVFDAPDQVRLRARWQRFGPRYLKADCVISVSRYSADEGIRLLGLDPGRIHVAHHGVDASFNPAPDGGSGHDDGRPYLLIVGEYSHRKGFAEAFAVIDDLADAGYPHRLLVAGRIHRWIADDVARLRAAARNPDRIELRGLVPDLLPLYQHAAAYLSTSRYEGFGMPALEAMACGAPVIAFSNTAVTEIVSSGGILVPDGDVEAMISAVRDLLDRPAAAVEWRIRGIEHVRQFTWEASAAKHVDAYRAAAANVD